MATGLCHEESVVKPPATHQEWRAVPGLDHADTANVG